MTDELPQWQTKELLERETGWRGIAVLARPELVVEIALDGVQSSTRYPGLAAAAHTVLGVAVPTNSEDGVRALVGV